MKISLNYLFLFIFSLLITISFLYFTIDILKPFIFGFLLAYFLDPITDKLESLKIPRFFAAIVLILSAFLISLVFFLFLLPVFYKQFYQFFQIIPNIYDWLLNFLKNNLENILGNKIVFDDAVENFQKNIENNIGLIFESFLTSTISILNFIVNSLITFILTFYILLDWDRLVNFLFRLIPNTHKKKLKKFFFDIDLVLSKLFRGQILVCFILSIYYGILLFILGLEAGLIVGVFAGLISFVPFVGAILGGGIASLLGILQFYDTPVFILVIVLIFIFGQIIEGNFLTPKFVGSSAGIHPIWLIFSLAFFGKIGGITGLILALPITAICGVLAKYLLKKYYSSNFFNT